MQYLGAWLLYGLAFFSASENKLAGYLLPLMPGLVLLLAVGLDHSIEKSTVAPWLLGASTASLIVLPTVVGALPDAFLTGVGRTQINLVLGTPFLLAAGVVWWLSWSGKPSLAILAGGMAVVFGVAYFKGAVFPELDDPRLRTRFLEKPMDRKQQRRASKTSDVPGSMASTTTPGILFTHAQPAETPKIICKGTGGWR